VRIDNEDGIKVAQVFDDKMTQVIAYPIGIPHCMGKQALHTIGSGFSGVFG
jgi:hypothetical protein